ncbi:MAG: membrane-bound lytic murein transglycosylase MltF [Deltaproteobacteria bacterium]|nr:membrane-bound lytic murein transglycosylase MltF [Deltaproteobacteria bacterium]
MSKKGVLILVLTILLFTVSCGKKDALDRIEASGKITVLMRNNAHCYYTYRERPMGFEYDLAKAFSQFLGVKLEVRTPTWEGLIEELSEGKADFVAAGMSITPDREKKIKFSVPYLAMQQRMILRKYNNRINEIQDLEGKTVHVRRGTSYEERLNELNREGMHINIKTHDDIPTEELIEMVHNRKIEITVADSNIALLNRRYYPDIRISFALEGQQSLAWAVNKGEKRLLKKINEFFNKIKEDGTFQKIYHKYFAHVDIFDPFDLKKYQRRLKSRLPRYKGFIQKAAKKHGFDWRLIASVIYQESHFDPEALSHTGVKGIMQLTRDTAMEMGIRDRRDPEQSIMGGVKYLRKLYDRFDSVNDPDRLFMTLASYNIGQGHVRDAQKIAKNQGKNSNRWTDLEKILPLLRDPKYYKKTGYGYCRGTEPVRYVERIRTYYDILKREAIS